MSYADVRHWYEDPPDESDLRDAEAHGIKLRLRELTGINVAALMEMEYAVETKSTDVAGGWSDWEEVARFLYYGDAKAYALHVRSYHGEKAQIDRVKIRVVHRGKELEVS